MEESFTGSSVPIIRYPSSPEPSSHGDVHDIEDTFDESPIRVGETNLSIEGFEKTLTNCLESKDFPKGAIEKTLVSVSQKAASIHVPPLKNISRLRTEHQAYELPDDHPLLHLLERREPDDPFRYLLIIWTTGEMSDSTDKPKTCYPKREEQAQIVRGTLLLSFMELAAKFPVSSGTHSSVSSLASTSTVPSDEANLQEETVKRTNDLTATKDNCDIVGDNDSQAKESVSKVGLEKSSCSSNYSETVTRRIGSEE